MQRTEFLAQYFFNEDAIINSRANLLLATESVLFLGYISSMQMELKIDIPISFFGFLVTALFISILKITRINLEYVKDKLRTEYPYYVTIKEKLDENSNHWLNKKGRVNNIMSKWATI